MRPFCQVPSRYATQFAFSRFNAPAASVPIGHSGIQPSSSPPDLSGNAPHPSRPATGFQSDPAPLEAGAFEVATELPNAD